MAAEHERVIRRFFEAFEGHGDAAVLAGMMSEDARFYGNRNWPPHEGRARIQQWWERMLDGPPHDTRVEMVHVASSGNTVFAERIDTAVRDGRRWYLSILGVGEVDEQGLIAEWRDYFGTSSNYPPGAAGERVRPMTLGAPPAVAAGARRAGWRGRGATQLSAEAKEAVVRGFFESWRGVPDVEKLTGFLSDRVLFYPHRDWAPYVGREAAREAWRGLVCADVEVEILHMASEGETVLVERIDRFTRTDTGERVELEVAGAGEVDEEGKITNWRDYFPVIAPPAVLP